MILRVIRGRAGAAELEALCEALQAALGPGSGELAGPTRLHLAARPSGDVADILIAGFWATAEQAASADGRGISPLVIAQQHVSNVLGEAYEVNETILRHADEEPHIIRVATGRFSKPGADVELLDLLRQRAPLLGDEMTEAYVARRIMGRAVDVTFVSAWLEPPADRRLDQPFWPDIALRYDAFDVGVYRTVSLSD